MNIQGTKAPDQNIWEKVLADCNFVADWKYPYVAEGPAWRWQTAEIDLMICRSISKDLRPDILMTGLVRTRRVLADIETSLPTTIRSREEALIWLARVLHDWDRHYPPAPPWLVEGQALLAAERAAATARYEARPRCSVLRAIIRPAHNGLRSLGDAADPEDVAIFEFDGEILRIQTTGLKFAVMAEGHPWPGPARVLLAPMRHLPKRIMNDPLLVDIWEAHLRLGRMQVPLIEHANGREVE